MNEIGISRETDLPSFTAPSLPNKILSGLISLCMICFSSMLQEIVRDISSFWVPSLHACVYTSCVKIVKAREDALANVSNLVLWYGDEDI